MGAISRLKFNIIKNNATFSEFANSQNTMISFLLATLEEFRETAMKPTDTHVFTSLPDNFKEFGKSSNVQFSSPGGANSVYFDSKNDQLTFNELRSENGSEMAILEIKVTIVVEKSALTSQKISNLNKIFSVQKISKENGVSEVIYLSLEGDRKSQLMVFTGQIAMTVYRSDRFRLRVHKPVRVVQGVFVTVLL